jgi:hypothetical protein
MKRLKGENKNEDDKKSIRNGFMRGYDSGDDYRLWRL